MVRPSCPLVLVAVIVVFGGALTSFAQAASEAKPVIPANSSSTIRQDESAPSNLRSLIKALSGKWHLSVRFEPTGEMPSGVTGSGEEAWHEGPGGFTFIEEEQIPTPAGQGYLLGIIWWDSRSKDFHGMECNSQLPFTCDLKGALADITVTWDEKSFVIAEIETHNGKKTIWHEVWSSITPTSFIQTGDVTQPDGSTTRFMTIRGTKEKESVN
jgi:hypothetical protein